MSDTKRTGTDRTDRSSAERREFLKHGAVALGAGWLGLGGVRELLASAEGISARAHITPPRVAAVEPFRIAAVGDSVVWGLGLAESSKFHTKVQAFLASRLNGRPIEKQVVAQSGATIGPLGNDAPRSLSGEVPSSYPSIIYQATRLVQNPASVHLVLLDGGINDVGAITILDPSVSVDWIRQQTLKVFGPERYVPFLRLMLDTFPNATIVLTNYFQVISGMSELAVVWALATLLGGPIGGIAATLGAAALKEKWSDQYRAFDEESTLAMARAVAAVNSPRLVFADNGFNSEHAVGTGAGRRLWNPGETDELGGIGGVRYQQCDAAYAEPRIANPDWHMCVNASVAHPNPAGAQAYASAIGKAITPFLASWGVPTMALSFVDGAATSTTKTVTVHARDAATGQPLSGTVRINGASGALGQPIRYSACYTYDVYDGVGTTTKTKVSTPCKGTVSVPGYFDTPFTH